MIVGFRSWDTEQVWQGRISRKYPPDIQKTALRKLRMLNVALVLKDLAAPPNNHLEALRGDRLGQHSIRINNQWRICFVWTQRGAEYVEIAGYH